MCQETPVATTGRNFSNDNGNDVEPCVGGLRKKGKNILLTHLNKALKLTFVRAKNVLPAQETSRRTNKLSTVRDDNFAQRI